MRGKRKFLFSTLLALSLFISNEHAICDGLDHLYDKTLYGSYHGQNEENENLLVKHHTCLLRAIPLADIFFRFL